MKSNHIKVKSNIIKGDRVIVITGSHKGTISVVLEVNNMKNLVKVEGVKLQTHFQKNDGANTGGLIKKEGWIQLSNISHVCNDGKPTKSKRVRTETGVKIFSKRTNEDLRLKSDLNKSTKVKLEGGEAKKELEKIKKEKFKEENKEKDISFHENDKTIKSKKKKGDL
jgi:large subunit ribosomal protein L24